MDALIIYLKDKPDGTVEVSLEAIGNPDRAMKIGLAIAENMQDLDYTIFDAKNEFNQFPTNSLLQ